MKTAIDTSVLVASLDAADPDHAASRKLILSGKPVAHAHALSETFSTLTGGRLGFRIASSDASALIRNQVAPRLSLVTLSAADLLDAYAMAESRGVRGAAFYDFLHLVAARKAGVARLHTLNGGDFRSFHRLGDPEIVSF